MLNKYDAIKDAVSHSITHMQVTEQNASELFPSKTSNEHAEVSDQQAPRRWRCLQASPQLPTHQKASAGFQSHLGDPDQTLNLAFAIKALNFLKCFPKTSIKSK